MGYEKLYQEQLLDHYKHPRNRGIIEAPDFSSGVFNPSCGDQVSIQGRIGDGIITECLFEGKGCVISLAAASMLTELVTGKTVKSTLLLSKEAMLALLNIELGPTRMRCALLAWEALGNALREVS